MIYQNLNENEIGKITKILDQHQVKYEVSVHTEAIEQLSTDDNDMFRKKAKRSGHTFMQIEIDLAEFARISPQSKDRLHALGIYEEVDSPFTEEELKTYTSDEYKQKKVADPRAKINQAAAIGAVLFFVALMLWKRFQ